VPAQRERIRVVVATGNPGKWAEIRAILDGAVFDVCGLDEWAPVDFPEEGADYATNAILKARTVAHHTGELAVADDSGLEVEALDNAPGPYSARYGGEALDDTGRVAHLLQALKAVAPDQRRARFVCVAAAVSPDGRTITARGECPGQILTAPRGRGGFGYDPIFQPAPHDRAMAELSSQEKNSLSHRAQAFRALANQLPTLAPPP